MVTVNGPRTDPSASARPSRRTAASRTGRPSGGRRRPPSGPRTPGTRPCRSRPGRPPTSSAAVVPCATAWNDRPTSRTPPRAGRPASTVHRKPDSPSPWPSRHPQTPVQARAQIYPEPGIENSYLEPFGVDSVRFLVAAPRHHECQEGAVRSPGRLPSLRRPASADRGRGLHEITPWACEERRRSRRRGTAPCDRPPPLLPRPRPQRRARPRVPAAHLRAPGTGLRRSPG